MASQDGRLSSKWGWLFLMTASTASALSLANVQPIIPTTVSISCILAYYSIIPDCTVDDFVRGDACSAACVSGLKRIQSNIQEACSGADIPSDSVLGQVLKGGLVELLCPNTPAGTPTSSKSRGSTAAPTTVTVRRTSTTTPALVFTTVRSTSTSSTPSTSLTTSTEAEDSDTPISSSSSTTTSTTTITTAVETTAPTSESSSSSQSATTSAAPTSGGSSDENSSGGGSPFDIASSDSSHLSARGIGVASMVIGLYVIFLQ